MQGDPVDLASARISRADPKDEHVISSRNEILFGVVPVIGLPALKSITSLRLRPPRARAATTWTKNGIPPLQLVTG
jgi:hypothetical protein